MGLCAGCSMLACSLVLTHPAANIMRTFIYHQRFLALLLECLQISSFSSSITFILFLFCCSFFHLLSRGIHSLPAVQHTFLTPNIMRSSTSPAALIALALLSQQATAAPIDLGAIGDWFQGIPETIKGAFGNHADTTLVFNAPAFQDPADPSKWLASVRSYTYSSSAATDTIFDMFQAFLKPFGVDVEGDDAASEILQERLKLFLTLGESDDTLKVSFPGCDGAEAANGPTPATGMLDQRTALGACPEGNPAINIDGQDSGAKAFLNAPDGWGVISDIDDTIKISHVLDKVKTVKKTLLEPLEAAPGMADLYRDVNTKLNDPGFLYLSGSPFQLYPMLHEYLELEGFPNGPIMLQNLSISDPAALIKTMSADPLDYKLGSIDRINEWYPQKKFLAVGDSGQRDSEVYGNAYRKFGGDFVGCIWIRWVEDERANNTDVRFEEAFKDVPRDKWRVFKDPAEMKDVDLAAGQC